MRNFKKNHKSRKTKVRIRRFEIVNYIANKYDKVVGQINYSSFVALLKQYKAFEGGCGADYSGYYGMGGSSLGFGRQSPCKIIKFPGTNKQRSLAARAKYGSVRRDRYMKRVA